MALHQPARVRPGRTRLARRLQPQPGADPTLRGPRLRPSDPVARAVLLSLENARSRISSVEAQASAGEAEGVHRLRTTTRRLRSELRAFRMLIEPEWLEPLEREMRWLAGLLGSVRDLDVLIARFRKAAAAEEIDEIEALAPLFDDLQGRHAVASSALRAALQGDRYHAILASVERAIEQPGFGGDADERCRKALPPLAASAWRQLKKCGRDLRSSDPDEAFHVARKRAKRARYTAEMVIAVLSGSAARGAHRFIRSTTRVQDVLGEHQDAVVASAEIASVLGRHPGNPVFEQAAHRLIKAQDKAARDARRAFFDAWDKLDRKKTRRWLRPSESTVNS